MNNLFATEDELIHYIEETLTSESNAQINSGTQISPCLLFKKEKEYLRPVPNEVLLHQRAQTIQNRIDSIIQMGKE